MAAAYEKQRKGFESLQRLVASLADSLNRPLPQLREATTRLAPEGGVSLITQQAGSSGIGPCCIPVPPSSLGSTAGHATVGSPQLAM